MSTPVSSDDNEPALVGAGSSFSAERFERWCAKSVLIDSKEMGRIPLRLLGTQRYVMQQIEAGLKEDIHTFVILKGRQIGISTGMLALDLYWSMKHKGLQGAVVTDTDENRELFRSNIALMLSSLPAKARRQISRHNRTQLMLKNGSRYVYMVAGTKKNGELGRAKSVNFLHGTETSSWGDEEGIGSLMNCLAQQNPNRLYIFESTARGYNAFFSMWETALDSSTTRAIFVGWWLNELYRARRGSKIYERYWDGQITDDEAIWLKEVFEKYGQEVDDEQIAWWRWYVDDQMKGDVNLALQEMPPTEDYAFRLSGSKFFKSERINTAFSDSKERECMYFRYVFGQEFEDTQFIETTRDLAEVILYETPVKPVDGKRGGTYSLGCDPAYGSSEWADWHAASMLRCYADRVVQVLEAGSPDWTDIQFAWVIAHLAGWYGNTMLNLEMQGPGSAVYNELGNLKKKASTFKRGDPRAAAFDVVGCVRDYLYKKQDSMGGNYAYQWQSVPKEKLRMMSTFRSNWERGIITLCSPRVIQQLRTVTREGDSIGGSGRAKDDFVLASAIGHIAWNDWLMLELQAAGETYAKAHEPQAQAVAFMPLERSVIGYLQKAGVKVPGINH